jgi:hypothetical protein
MAPAQCCEKQQRRRVNVEAFWDYDKSMDDGNRPVVFQN